MIAMFLVVLEQSLLHIPLVIGAYVSLSLLKVPDLSIESAYVVGAIVGAYALIPVTIPIGLHLLLVLCASLVGGALVGVISSMLTQKAGVPHLLSSIITIGLFHGINQFVSPVYVALSQKPNPLSALSACCMHIPRYPDMCMLIVIVVCVVSCMAFLFRTQIGYAYAVYGNNPFFFSNYGICTSFVFVTGIVCANALAGLSGYLVAQSNMVVELNMGLGKALFCITALILGKAFVPITKPFSIVVPLVGTLAYFVVQQGLLKVGFNLKYFTAVQALLVLCMLLYSYRKQPRQSMHDNLGV